MKRMRHPTRNHYILNDAFLLACKKNICKINFHNFALEKKAFSVEIFQLMGHYGLRFETIASNFCFEF